MNDLRHTNLTMYDVENGLVNAYQRPCNEVTVNDDRVRVLVVFIIQVLVLLTSLLMFRLRINRNRNLANRRINCTRVGRASTKRRVLLISNANLLPLLSRIRLRLAALCNLGRRILLNRTTSRGNRNLTYEENGRLLVCNVVRVRASSNMEAENRLRLVASRSVLHVLNVMNVRQRYLQCNYAIVLRRRLSLLNVTRLLGLVSNYNANNSQQGLLKRRRLRVAMYTIPTLNIVIKTTYRCRDRRYGRRRRRYLTVSFRFLRCFLLLLGPVLLVGAAHLRTPLTSLGPTGVKGTDPSAFVPA